MGFERKKKNNGGFLVRIGALAVVLVFITVCAASPVTGMFTGASSSPEGAKTFFTQFIIAGGPIVWFILLPMSVVTLYLAIDLSFSLRRKKLLPANIVTDIIAIARGARPLHLSARIAERDDLVSTALARTLAKSRSLSADTGQAHRFAVESLQDCATGLLRNVEWCSIIGNVAPMVGLFGTVFGMIKAFNILGMAGGQPRPDQLAAAISVALVTTFWGLVIAIPALAMHGVFRARVEAIVSEAAIEVETVLIEITPLGVAQVPTAKKTPAPVPSAKPTPARLETIRQKIQANASANTNTAQPVAVKPTPVPKPVLKPVPTPAAKPVINSVKPKGGGNNNNNRKRRNGKPPFPIKSI